MELMRIDDQEVTGILSDYDPDRQVHVFEFELHNGEVVKWELCATRLHGTMCHLLRDFNLFTKPRMKFPEVNDGARNQD